MTKEELAHKWVNDGDWGSPVDKTGQWMFDKLVEAFKAGYEARAEQLHKHDVGGSVCPTLFVNVKHRVFKWDSSDLYKIEQTDR